MTAAGRALSYFLFFYFTDRQTGKIDMIRFGIAVPLAGTSYGELCSVCVLEIYCLRVCQKSLSSTDIRMNLATNHTTQNTPLEKFYEGEDDAFALDSS